MHARSSRIGLALWAAATFMFAVASDAYGLHPCPHHGLKGSVASETEASQEDLDHAAARMGADDADSHEQGHSKGRCTCIGDCSGAGSLGMPAVAEVRGVTAFLVAVRRGLEAADPLLTPFPSFFLPPATAPPLT